MGLVQSLRMCRGRQSNKIKKKKKLQKSTIFPAIAHACLYFGRQNALCLQYNAAKRISRAPTFPTPARHLLDQFNRRACCCEGGGGGGSGPSSVNGRNSALRSRGLLLGGEYSSAIYLSNRTCAFFLAVAGRGRAGWEGGRPRETGRIWRLLLRWDASPPGRCCPAEDLMLKGPPRFGRVLMRNARC